MPDGMNAALFDTLQQIGRQFGQTGQFDRCCCKIWRNRAFPTYLVPLYRLLSRHSPAFILLGWTAAEERGF